MTAPTTTQVAEINEFIGHHVRTYRKRLRLSQEDLAHVLDKSLGTVSGWERGRTSITAADLVAVAVTLGQPMSAFLPRGGA